MFRVWNQQGQQGGGVKDDTTVWSCGGRMDENVFARLLFVHLFVLMEKLEEEEVD